jgi:hypothetical protein
MTTKLMQLAGAPHVYNTVHNSTSSYQAATMRGPGPAVPAETGTPRVPYAGRVGVFKPAILITGASNTIGRQSGKKIAAGGGPSAIL